MRVQAYDSYNGLLQIAVTTPRDGAAPSSIFTAGSIHNDYCARVAALLREHKHVGESALAWPATHRLQNYFPQHSGSPLYALRQLQPAGIPRDIDPDFNLEVMRIRYQFTLVWLPAAWAAEEKFAEGMSRHLEKAVHDLFTAHDCPDLFIPGESGARDDTSTVIDIVVELGAAQSRRGVDLTPPAA